ncbi:MAG: hypothetical protein ACYS99_03560 [Planctomycetota bacterium]|jgi:hypothetical protein
MADFARSGLSRLLFLLLLVNVAGGEHTPPGDYSDTGLVVRTARFGIDLFDGGRCCLTLTEELQAVLAQHLGEIVRVDYTRVEMKEGMLWDSEGSPIGRIRKVTTLAKSLDALPVRIEVRPLKARFALAEPVSVDVVFTNTTKEPVDLRLGSGECTLFEDYHRHLRLRAPKSDRVASPPSAGAGAAGLTGPPPERPPPPAPTGPARRVRLPAGKVHRVKIESAWMAKPGRYQAVYALPGPDEWNYQSPPADVEVLAPPDKAAELEALRAWLTRAALEQRVEIAERMIGLGDDSGVAEVVRLLDAPRFYGPSRIYRFLWKYGGKAVEKLLLERLARCGEQAAALTIIEEIHRSPRAVAMLEDLLADRRKTRASFSGWCDRPRICDIAAAWLAGYVQELGFPVAGTEEERDATVGRVLRALRDDPTRFSVLR